MPLDTPPQSMTEPLATPESRRAGKRSASRHQHCWKRHWPRTPWRRPQALSKPNATRSSPPGNDWGAAGPAATRRWIPWSLISTTPAPKAARSICEDADLMIAAIALAHDAELATGNLRHFRRFPDLPLEDWIRQPPPDPNTQGHALA